MIVRELITGFFMLSGIVFFLTTAVALVRFPDFFSRMHAASKCLVGGGVSVLLGLIIQEGPSPLSFRLLLLTIFLLITSPVVGHALSLAAYKYGHFGKLVRDDLKERKVNGD